MEVILKIPKQKEEIKKIATQKKKKVVMEIINSAEFCRINIRFSEEPPEAVKKILVAENWFYSSRLKLWYGTPKEKRRVRAVMILQRCFKRHISVKGTSKNFPR